MHPRATIDFETRSVAKIKNVGGWIYSVHPSTQPLCLAFALKEDDEPRLWAPDWTIKIVGPWYFEKYGVPINMDCPWLYAGDCPQDLAAAIAQNSEIEAHNAFFERSIWNNVMVPIFDWPRIKEEQWRCSAAKASAYALPRALEDAVKALGLPFPKDMEGNRVMLKLARPRKARKAEKKILEEDGWTLAEGSIHEWVKEGQETLVHWNEKPEDIFRTWEYCRQDVRAERALSQTLADLSPDELKVWQVDQIINLRGVRIDREMAKASLRIADQAVKRATKQAIKAATIFDENGNITTSAPFKTLGQRDKLLAWIHDQGVMLPNMQGAVIDEILKSPLPDHVQTVLSAKRTASRTSVRKYAKMLETASLEDDRIRDVFMYHGAGTGRWTGRFVQTQNLVRGKMKDPDTMCGVILEASLDWLETCYSADPMEVLSWATRGAICSSPGRDLVVADYAGVEARGLLWFVMDEEGLKIFRRPKGEPGIYREMAAEIYKVNSYSIDKKTNEGFLQRFMGKQAILGLGYGMGWKKFQATCAKYGVEISAKFAKFVVKTYRERFWQVAESWKRLERAAIKACRNPETPFHADRVTYLRKGKFLYCRLPSGRKLAYCKPVIVPSKTPWGETKPKLTYMTVDGKTHKWVRTDTYGGKLMENIIQGLCRDLEAYAIVNVEKGPSNPYDVVMHTHDELVSECDEGVGDVKEFEQLISRLPSWAEDFPLKAEGWRGKRYRKD
jgi:DNA polymerase